MPAAEAIVPEIYPKVSSIYPAEGWKEPSPSLPDGWKDRSSADRDLFGGALSRCAALLRDLTVERHTQTTRWAKPIGNVP
jgi:hypothetical protein